MTYKLKIEDLRPLVENAIREYLNTIDYDYLTKSSKTLIREGLTMSYAPRHIVSIMNKRYPLKEWGVNINPMQRKPNYSFLQGIGTKNDASTRDIDGWFDLEFVFTKGFNVDIETINNIITTMDRCGWILANITIYNGMQPITYPQLTQEVFDLGKSRTNMPKLIFQAKFDEVVDPNELPPYCYHICPERVLNKIKTQGLTPRAEFRSANHPERVYLFLRKPIEWNEIANRFREKNDEPYCLLSISMEKIKDKIQFSYDSNLLSDYPSIYTFEPIPANVISLIDKQEN